MKKEIKTKFSKLLSLKKRGIEKGSAELILELRKYEKETNFTYSEYFGKLICNEFDCIRESKTRWKTLLNTPLIKLMKGIREL